MKEVRPHLSQVKLVLLTLRALWECSLNPQALDLLLALLEQMAQPELVVQKVKDYLVFEGQFLVGTRVDLHLA